VLALTWLASGLIGLAAPAGVSQAALQPLGIGTAGARTLGIAACLWDMVLAACIAVGRHGRWLGGLQLATVLGYTGLLSLTWPVLWADPFGPLLKNLPFLLLIPVWTALRDQR
jgi:hypothetical protein